MEWFIYFNHHDFVSFHHQCFLQIWGSQRWIRQASLVCFNISFLKKHEKNGSQKHGHQPGHGISKTGSN